METRAQQNNYQSNSLLADPIMSVKPDAGFCFELSWEVCNKVGGIYTVVKSKVPRMLQEYPARYVAVGPYVPVKVKSEFVESTNPPIQFKQIFDTLRNEGIVCHYGKWLIKGEPQCILIEFSGFSSRKEEFKSKFWETYNIDSWQSTYFDYDEPLIWSVAAGKLVEAFANANPSLGPVVMHCHEWLATGAALYTKMTKAPVATVFTTHATMLGRTLASADIDLYNILDKIDPQEEAYKKGVQTKFLTEKAAAASVDVFSTVSGITGIEAEKLLSKKPDILLPNGLDMEAFETFEELAIKHSRYKRSMKEFLISFFFPYYSFDMENTLLFFSSGRYEFHDKGFDVLIDALGKLNRKLKESKSDKDVVVFIWVPAGVKGIKSELLQSIAFYNDIMQTVDENMQDIRAKIIHGVSSEQNVCIHDIFTGQNAVELKSKVMQFLKRNHQPLLCTHELYNESSDSIVQGLNRAQLMNLKEDKVKVIFYPMYLQGADGLLDLNNYEAMMAGHLGIFPSCYEPWGYTPLECAALGVASVTTDLAGFGLYLQSLRQSSPSAQPTGERTPEGVFVVRRMNTSYEEVVEQLASIMETYCAYPKEMRINEKLKARTLAMQCDWSRFVKYYIKAHNLAIEKMKKRMMG